MAQRNAFGVAAATRFERNQLAAQVIAAGLGPAGNGVGCRSMPRRHAHVRPMLDRVAQIRTPFQRHDRHVHRRITLGQHAQAARAAKHDRSHIGRPHAVGADHFVAGRVDFFFAVADLDFVHASRLEQAARVVGEAEIGRALRGGVDALALEYRRAVVQRVGADVNRRFGPGFDLAVVPEEWRSHRYAPSNYKLATAAGCETGCCRSMRLTMASAACAVASMMSVLTPLPRQSRSAWRAVSWA